MSNSSTSRKPISHAGLWLLAVAIGVVSGLGAALFRGLIGLVHNLFFLGKLSWAYDANVHTPPSPWGGWVVLAPVVGAAGVAFLVKNFALEAKGHGVPEVMDAIYYHKGNIRPVVALIKSLASALSIGSGGSAGREGPIVQIGSSFGSTVGQLLRLPAWQRITMLAAGAGGGIAATFNTPIGGVLFAAELLLHEVSVWTLVPVVISTATATYIGQLLLGANPSFVIPAFETPYFHAASALVLLACVGLGFLTGAVSALFLRTIYWAEDFFDRAPGNYYTRHMAAMCIVGLFMEFTRRTAGHYYIVGIGYATIQDVLGGALASLPLLLGLFALKIVTTSLTLGSGGSGGIFSPSLFIGSTLGGAYGALLARLLPTLAISPPAFAVAGMAGVVAGSTGAAITAIVMIFEMTLDYRAILPMTLTVAISYGVRNFLSRHSIYTLKLARRGHFLPEALQANFHLVRLAKDVMDHHIVTIAANTPLRALPAATPNLNPAHFFLVEDKGKVVGLAENNRTLHSLLNHCNSSLVGEVASKDFEIVTESTTVFELISRTRSHAVKAFLISSQPAPAEARDVRGVVSKERITDAIADSIGLFNE